MGIIQAQNVTMEFRMYNDRINSLKEFFIKKMTRKLKSKAFTALKDVSFSIERGEVFGIIGSNGAGKSTLLKVISGILVPTKGDVKINGTIAPLLELGAGFDVDLTARENIFLNGAVLGYSKKYLTERYNDIVEFAELADFMDTPIRNFSSGMTMRLAFSIATIVNPDILIVDEILAVGDARFQQKSLTRMKELMDGGTTVLLVSHSIQQIRELCTRVVWLEHGHVRMIGDTEDVCDTYLQSIGIAPPKRINKDIRNWQERLYSPTYIHKIGGLYFIVDCWHHRVIFNDNIDAPISDWKVMSEELRKPHSVASDGTYYLVEDTDNDRIACFRLENGEFVLCDFIYGVGRRPNRIIYDEKMKRFIGISADSGQIFVIKRDGDLFKLDKLHMVKDLIRSHVRSIYCFDDVLYCVSGPGRITALKYDDLSFDPIASYEVPFELMGMNDMIRVGEYFYFSVYQDGSMAIEPKLVRTRDLKNLANGDYEDIFQTLGIQGVPYGFSQIDDRVFLTEIDYHSSIISFALDDEKICDARIHYNFGGPNANSMKRLQHPTSENEVREGDYGRTNF